MNRLVSIGRISRLHGYKGDFIVAHHSGPDSALAYLKHIFVGQCPESSHEYSVVSARWMPKGWKLHVEGIESEVQAEMLRERSVYANRSEFRDLLSNEFYTDDLVGAEVYDGETSQKVGDLVGIESVPHMADRWWVKTGSMSIAIPALKTFIDKVDVNKKKIWVKNLSQLPC